MVASKKHNQEDFVISGDYSDEEAEDLRREDYYSHFTGVFRKKSIIPFVIGGVGLIVLVIIFVIILSEPKDVVDRAQLQSLEARIQQLEKRLASIGIIDQALDRIAKQERKFSLFNKRFDRFETTVTSQIDQIIKELGVLHQKTAHAPAPKAQPSKPVVTTKKEIKPKFHQVHAGEALFGISRRYGLTVEQLRSYNNIDPNAAIHPGQKLRLTPK